MCKQVDTEKFIAWLVAWSIHGHSEIWIVMIDAMTADDMIRGDTMSMEVAISWQWLFSLMSNRKSKPLEVLGFPGCWMEIWRKWKFDGFESCTVHDWFLLRRKNQFYGNRKESTKLKSNVIGFSRCWMIMEKSQWFGRV